MIILQKMLIITGVLNEKTNELTIYGIFCQNVTDKGPQFIAELPAQPSSLQCT